MNEHEDKFIASFIVKEKQDRYRFLLGSPDSKRRDQCLNRLNHCSDLNEKYVSWLPRNADVVALLRQAGSPKQVYLMACSSTLDGKTMPLDEAIQLIPEDRGWGTIVSCIPGKLAYYYDEEGLRRAILRREPEK
jgi:hypothetical protein